MSGPAPGAPALGDLVARALALPGERVLLGLAGPPGAGKTTLALALVAAVRRAAGDPLAAAHVPMDGYHLADVELERLGRRERKGAPDTFDAAGYAALLRRLREQPAHREEGLVYAPAFDREVEQPIAGSVPVHPGTRLVVSEGNYLLLDDAPWRRVRALFDEVWFVAAEPGDRTERLVRRHVAFGKEPASARSWVQSVDLPNAALVEASAPRADLQVPGDLVLPAPEGR